MKKTNKLLAILLAILMIATTVPFAFAADGIPDFSDAKVLTAVSGELYIDGEVAKYLPAGKYKLTGDISTTVYLSANGEVVLDLNGYTWDLNTYYISVNAPLSVYDTSAGETGKITSSARLNISLNAAKAVFSLYGGTIENTSSATGAEAIDATWASVNLYGGKIKSNGSAIHYNMGQNITINLDGTVLEVGEGYAQISGGLGVNESTANAVIDVTDYKGEPLTADVKINNTVGKLKIFKGISAEDAEKYTVNVTCDEAFDYFFEKEEYDEATGEKYIYIAENAFTQQPSAENNYTVDFNNPNTSFQWYEVEGTVLTEENVWPLDPVFKNGKWIVENNGVRLFAYDIKAGDVLMVSTNSAHDRVCVETGFGLIELGHSSTSGTMTFDFDGTVDVWVPIFRAENPVELEFSIIKETALDGETGKTLQNPECGKSYYCKATVGGKVYTSDSVVGHVITQVDAKAKTCTEIGWDAYVYCTVCAYTTYNEIPASHEIVNVEAQAPTCTEIGWDAYEYCTDCTYTTYVEKEALNHKDTLVQVDAKAKTCTEIGWDAYIYCTECDYTTYVEIPASHEIKKVEAKAPTCTEIGWDAYEYCTVCDYTTYAEKAALDHDIVIDAYVAPKCTQTGLTAGQHCSRCDDMTVAQEVIPDLGGHINEDGNTTCDRCGETLLCSDCGRPVHAEEGIPRYICWLISIIKTIVSFFK